MINNICLNCENELNGKYCSECGQKSDTQRITLKRFIFHDVLHGTLHLEKGILFTAKQALICPGRAALNYIEGKRKRYYNVFLLILIIIGLLLFLRHNYEALLMSQGRLKIEKKVELNEVSKKFDDFFSQKSKIIILLFVPLAAVNSLILFKRKKLNLSEHAIIAGMILLGMLLFATFAHFIFYINIITTLTDFVYDGITIFFIAITLIYIGYAYYNAFQKEYSLIGILSRVILFFVLMFFEIFALLIISIGILTNWQSQEVIISPF